MSQEEEFEYEYVEEEVEEEEIDEDMPDSFDGALHENSEAVKSQQASRKAEYQIFTAEDLLKKQERDVFDAHEVLNVSLSTAGALLRHYGWDKEKLYTPFFEDPERVCKKAGVALSAKSTFIRGPKGKNVTCTVCFDDFEGQKTAGLIQCSHMFCDDCWKHYLHAKIDQGPSCLTSQCPQPNCTSVIDETIVKEVANKDDFQKFGRYLSRSFVDDNPHIKWCPTPNCGRAVYAPELTISVVQCDCGMKFCFKCGAEAHAPCGCAELKEWIKKEKDESETANWLTINTKDCPKCHSSMEKNGGCNHMTCTRCRHEFCWICMDDWSKHGSQTGGFYSCNKFKPNEQDSKNKEQARVMLERYMFYYTRYANHDRSRKFEGQLRKKAEDKMRELQQINKYSSWIDVEYIQQGVQTLIQSRSILKYTYVFAFNLKPGKEKDIFEWLQEDLEKSTERLSEILEAPTEKFDRDNIIATTKNTEKRIENLLEGVENGLMS